MSEEERLLKFENELNFGIETRDGTFYVPKDVAVKAASELLDELAQPQLTIPKSIAKKIDKFIKVLHFLNEFEAIKYLSALDLNGDRTPKWLKDNPMLVFAYLAGKAFGVDLVKVVADENVQICY